MMIEVDIHSCSHTRSNTEILRDIRLNIGEGDRIAICGPSGAGKSTLFNVALGLLNRKSWTITGRVFWKDRNLLEYDAKDWQSVRGSVFRFLLQNPALSVNPGFKIGHQLRLALSCQNATLTNEELQGFVGNTLNCLRLDNSKKFLSKYPPELSKGQLQRIGLALALISPCDYLFADEPFNALDSNVSLDLIDLVKQEQAAGRIKTVVVISHDEKIIEALECSHLYVMERGGLVRRFDLKPDAHVDPHCLDPLPELRTPPRPLKSESVSFASFYDQKLESKKLSPSSGDYLTVKDLSAGYKTKGFLFPKKTLGIRNASFHIAKGEFVGLIGNSGEGKSTLGLALADLCEVFEGRFGTDANVVSKQSRFRGDQELRRNVQYLVQDAASSFDPSQSLRDNLMECAEGRGLDPIQVSKQISWLMKFFLLEEFHLDKYPSELSGGQKQRLAIIRAVLGPPELLVADEPFVHLDRSLQARLADLLRTLNETPNRKLSCVLISHDLGAVLELCSRIYFIDGGRIVAESASREVGAIQHPLVRQFFEAARRLGNIEGDLSQHDKYSAFGHYEN